MKIFAAVILCVSLCVFSGCRVQPEDSVFSAPLELADKMVFVPTFDDGPISEEYVEFGVYPKNEEQMLESLKKTLEVLDVKNATAVFFVVFVHAEKGAPDWSPKSSEKKMEQVFRRGVKMITDAGHVVALHACDHDMFHKLFLSHDEAKKDMIFLISQLNESGCEYYPTWRVPYGGMRTFMDEQKLARELNLPVKLWDINSHDWTTNHDSTPTLKRVFSADERWVGNVNKNLRREVRKTRRRPATYRDVLFHVSPRTSKYLGEFLETVEDEGKKVYGQRFMYLSTNSPQKQAMLEYYLTAQPIRFGQPVKER